MLRVLLILLISPIVLFSQKSGKVTYDMIVQVEIPDRVPPQFRDRIPKEQKTIKELYFHGAESNYKTGEQTEEEVNPAENDRAQRFRRRFSGGIDNGQTYKNTDTDEMIDKRNLMDKDFIINDTLPEYKWKVTGQKKQILSYLVMEATTMVNDTIPVVAWFTPQIPVSNGPATYQGLPGLILELDINNGQKVTVAKEVTLGPIEEGLIEAPRKGKKVTMEEFEKIRKEKAEERREQRGDRGGRGRRGE